jgi:hypothetical protein
MKEAGVGLVAAVIMLSAVQAAFGQPAARSAEAPAPAAGSETTSEISVRTWADRTALWVGDSVNYNVEIRCAPTVDLLADDLAKDKLPVEGLEVVDASTNRVVSEDGSTLYQFSYRLTSYESGTNNLKIGDLSVRYGRRRAGQRLEESTPAGELLVPGLSLALRSTLPDDLTSGDARDRRPLEPAPALVRLAQPVGLGLILLSAAPLIVWAGAFVKSKAPRRRRDTRAVRNQTRAALEQLAAVDAASEDGRREGYTRLDAIVRQHVAEITDIPARALTPAELAARLGTVRNPLPAEDIAAVLQECERARYGTAAVLPPPQRFRDSVSTVEQALAAR